MIVRKMNPQSNNIMQMNNASPDWIKRQRMLTEYYDVNNLMIQYTTQPAQTQILIYVISPFNSLKKWTVRLKDQADHTVEGLWRAANQVNDEYFSIEYGHLYSHYNECIKQNGDNRYKNPHDGVRVKFNNGDPLNKCNLTFNEYLVLRRETEEWFHANGW